MQKVSHSINNYRTKKCRLLNRKRPPALLAKVKSSNQTAKTCKLRLPTALKTSSLLPTGQLARTRTHRPKLKMVRLANSKLPMAERRKSAKSRRE